MVSTINRVHSFVKSFRAYLAKGPFKNGKNNKLLRALKDDPRKARSKKIIIPGIKEKKQVIEEAFGVESGTNVKAIYVMNLKKQRHHSKIYLENKHSLFALRKPPDQAIPEGVEALAYSHKYYENDCLANKIEIKERGRPETSNSFNFHSLFSRNYTDKPINSHNDKDVNPCEESQSTFVNNNNQLCPYCQCRMKYIEERRKYQMGSSYTSNSSLNYNETIKWYNSTMNSPSECKTRAESDKLNDFQSIPNAQEKESGKSEVESSHNIGSFLSMNAQEKPINSEAEGGNISRKEIQNSFKLNDDIPNTCQPTPKNTEETEYDKPEFKKSSNLRSLFYVKGETRDKQMDTANEADMIFRKESQNSFKTNNHNMRDSCKPVLLENIEDKVPDQSEKQTAFENQTVLTQSETKGVGSEELSKMYQQESQKSPKINNQVPDTCQTVTKNIEEREYDKTEWKKALNIRSLFSITTQEKRIDPVDEVSVEKKNLRSSKINDYVRNTYPSTPKNIENTENEKPELKKSFNIRSLFSTKGETQEHPIDSAGEVSMISPKESGKIFRAQDHIPDCCKTLLYKNMEDKLQNQSEKQTEFQNRTVATQSDIKGTNLLKETGTDYRKKGQTSSKISDNVPETCQAPKNIGETEYDKPELKKSFHIRSLYSVKGEIQEKPMDSADEVDISRKEKSFKTNDPILHSFKPILPKNIEEKMPDQSKKPTTFKIRTVLTEINTKSLEPMDKKEGEINIESKGKISGRSDEKKPGVSRISEQVSATNTREPVLESCYKNKLDKDIDLTISTMTNSDAHNGENKYKYDNHDITYKNTIERSLSRSDENKADVIRIPEKIGGAQVLEPFLGLANQKDNQQPANQSMSTTISPETLNSVSKFRNNNSEPYLRVRSYYKTVPNHFGPHLEAKQEPSKDENQMEIKNRYKEESAVRPKQHYKYRVTFNKIPATSVKGDEKFIMPPPPLPPIIPTDKVAESNPMNAESVNTKKMDITDERKMGEPSNFTSSKLIEIRKNDQEKKVEVADEIKEKPVCIHHDQFGYGDPYFHIRSYYRVSPHLKDHSKYPIQAPAFVPEQRPPGAPEPDPKAPTTLKPKKHSPCDRLKKGYCDPPKRLYSTYSFHVKCNNAGASRSRDIKAVASNLQSNSCKDLSRRTISKKSNTNLKCLSALRIYNIGRF